MFLNNISIYSIPVIGMVFVIISLTYSKTINLFSYQLSRKHDPLQSVNIPTNDSSLSHVSIQVNPLYQYQIPSTSLPFDDNDDEDLIESEMFTSNFCDNDSIELRLDQDMEYDPEQDN